MKSFFKAILVVLLFGIIIGTVATSGKKTDTPNTQLISTIDKFEEDINKGSVVIDGVISDNNPVVDDTTNTMANIFQSVGKGVVDGISAILKFISSIFSSFVG